MLKSYFIIVHIVALFAGTSFLLINSTIYYCFNTPFFLFILLNFPSGRLEGTLHFSALSFLSLSISSKQQRNNQESTEFTIIYLTITMLSRNDPCIKSKMIEK